MLIDDVTTTGRRSRRPHGCFGHALAVHGSVVTRARRRSSGATNGRCTVGCTTDPRRFSWTSPSAHGTNVLRLEEVIRWHVDRFLDGLQHAMHFDELESWMRTRSSSRSSSKDTDIISERRSTPAIRTGGRSGDAETRTPDPKAAHEVQKRHHGDGRSIRTFDTAAIMHDLRVSCGWTTIVEEDVVDDDVLPQVVKSALLSGTDDSRRCHPQNGPPRPRFSSSSTRTPTGPPSSTSLYGDIDHRRNG